MVLLPNAHFWLSKAGGTGNEENPTSLKVGVGLCEFTVALWIQIKGLLQEGNQSDVVGLWSNVSAARGDNSFNSLIFEENMPQRVL